jgi:hypothetical protein
MIAAGSPGLRYKSAKTKTATTAMTGIVAMMRRTIYANMGRYPGIPAKAGIRFAEDRAAGPWVPAFAGTTVLPLAAGLTFSRRSTGRPPGR